MKKLYIMLLAMLCCVVSASAQSFEVDGISYSVTSQSSAKVTVTSGEIREEIEIPETVTYNEVTYTVTSIGNSAFSGRRNSQNFTRKYIIPGTVQTIGDGAFYDNYYLEEVELHEGLQTIGSSAFGYAFQLKGIRIPSTVTSIAADAFITNQQNRATISCLAATPPSIQSSTFSGRTDATLHVVVSDIEAYREAEYWKDFSEITGDILFTDRCYAPVITNENGLLTMSCKTEGATIYYTTDGSKPDENAIRYTSPISYNTGQIIRAIAIAEGYENSAIRNFYDKEQVENINDEQGVTYILKQDENRFYYSVTGHSDEMDAEIVIPAFVRGIPVNSIEESSFSGCTILSSITIPNSVVSIGSGAFAGCTSLISITIPESVKSIGNSAFSDCSGLKMVTSEISSPFAVNAFNSFDALLVVPRGSRSDYKSVSGWGFAFTFEEGETIYDLEQTDEQGIYYSLKSDDNSIYYSVTGHSDELNTEIVIPTDLSGCPVRTIEDGNKRRSGMSNVTPPYSYDYKGVFSDCTDLISVTISNNVTHIGDCAFAGCTSLTSVTIPNSVISIGSSAFANCSALTKIKIPKKVTTIGEEAFWCCTSLSSITIPNSVTTLGCRAFYLCNSLSSVTIGTGVTSLEVGTFQECTGLSTLIIPSSVTTIGDGTKEYLFSNQGRSYYYNWGVFYGCTSLTSVTFPGSLISIGSYAFNGCDGLTSVSFEDGLTNIGEYAFANCSLTSITIPNSVTNIGNNAFENNRSLTTAILGDGITEIRDRAFQSCNVLTSVKLPNSLTSMGEFVFSGCPLNSIELPNSFTVIPDNLLSNCNFQYIKLGNNVKSIGKNAFGSREPVIVIDTPTPPTIASDAFPYVQYLADLNVIVPDAKAETAYRKAAVWQEMTFSNQNNISEVTVETPGDLSFELITQCNMMPAKVVGMKVNGTINADDFNQMLVNMKSLLRLDLSDCNITAIPDNAMKGKMQLKELILPTKLQTIGQSAFQGCTFLSELTMQNGLQTIGKNAFQGCTGLTGELNLPSTLTTIGESAFVGTDYSSVKMPSTLKTIGNYAFNNVPIKQQLTLPKKVTSVGASAFAGTKITGLEIPDGVTSIGDNAFANTPIEGHVTIPDGVTYLGKGAFRNSQLSTVFLPNSVTELSQGAFQGCPNLNLVYVPDNYTGLSSSVFDGCGALQILRLSANLTSMGSYSLQNTPLEYIKVPSQVEVLSQGVLRNCKSLESLSLPSSLKTVEGEALYGCISLRNLSIEAIEPPVIKDKSAIRGINTDLCLISIPTQSYRKYVLAEYWGQFVQMRNDIAVETSGNGEIAFESVNDDEEDEEDEVSETREFDLGTGAARVRRRVAELATEDEESMAIANNGSTIYVPQQGKVRFYIIPAEGEELISATLDGEDIMPYIVDGVYTATADKRNAKLVVVFSGDGQGGGAGLMGDVNGDGTVSVTDVGCVINFILEQVPEPFITAAADMNSDGSISVTDVGYIINYILNDGAACRAEQMATYIYDVPMLMPNANGYVLTLDGADAFIGFQMDIFVPEYANGCSVQLKNTGTSHQLACRQLSDGHYRVVCYSPVNETFPKGLTDLLTFATESDMSISDIRFTTEGLDEVRFDDMNATPTSIASVTDLKAADIRVYTLDGQLCRIVRAKSGENPLKDLQPGIYLINDRKYIIR